MNSMKYFIENMKYYFMEKMNYFIEKMKYCGKGAFYVESMMEAWHLRRIYFSLLLEESSFKRRI